MIKPIYIDISERCFLNNHPYSKLSEAHFLAGDMSMSQEIITRIFSILCCSICLLFATLTVYYGYHFYQERSNPIIRKRYSTIVFIINIFGLPLLLIAYPSVYVSSITKEPYDDYALPWAIVYPYCGYGLTLFTALRFYLINYDVQFLHASKNLQWKTYITTDKHTLEKDNYYVQHKNTLGNSRHMIKRCLITVIILGIIYTTLKILQHTVSDGSEGLYQLATLAMDFLFYMIPLLITVIMWCKTPPFQDTILVQQEMKVIAILYCCCLISYALFFALGAVVSESEFLARFLSKYVVGLVGIIACFCTTFPSVFLITRFLRKRTKDEMFIEISVNESTMQPHAVQQSNSSTTYSRVKLPTILNEQGLYDMFMQHLMSEFSLENLLAFTEFMQYQHCAYKAFNLEYKESTNSHHLQRIPNFIENAPKSSIVYQNAVNESDEQTKMNSLKTKAHSLYLKYVREGAQFEINISFNERFKLINLMSDKEKWMDEKWDVSVQDLCDVFAISSDQIYRLMVDSTTRFKTNTGFKRYVDSRDPHSPNISLDLDYDSTL
eukprot:108641_1